MKPPSRSLLCEWVKSSWAEIPEEVIRNSFLSCAIIASTDGTDDDKIHCFKSGEECAEGRKILAEEMSNFEVFKFNDVQQLPSDDENDGEKEENEALIEDTDEDESSNSDSSTLSETESDELSDNTIIL